MVSESQKRATKNFEEKAYFKTLVRFKKEDEARIRAAAGDSLNGFIVKCVLNAIDGQSTQNVAPINPDPIMDSLVADADESRLQAPDWIQSCKTESEKRDALQAFIDAKRQEIAAAKKRTPGAVTEEDAKGGIGAEAKTDPATLFPSEIIHQNLENKKEM